MARVNVYLPDDLADEARRAGLNVSGLAQDALRAALQSTRLGHWLDGLDSLSQTGVSHETALAAVADARDELGA